MSGCMKIAGKTKPQALPNAWDIIIKATAMVRSDALNQVLASFVLDYCTMLNDTEIKT